jgi:hypothetical protein
MVSFNNNKKEEAYINPDGKLVNIPNEFIKILWIS